MYVAVLSGPIRAITSLKSVELCDSLNIAIFSSFLLMIRLLYSTLFKPKLNKSIY